MDRFADAEHTGAAGRFGIWKVGMEAFKQHWLLGAGIGNYRAVYNSVFIQVYQAYSGGWDVASRTTCSSRCRRNWA